MLNNIIINTYEQFPLQFLKNTISQTPRIQYLFNPILSDIIQK